MSSNRTEMENDVPNIYFGSKYMRILAIIRMATSSLGFALLFTMELYRKKFVAHNSLKLLMTCHAFWILVYCVETLIDSLLTAVNYYTAIESTDILLSSTQCLLRKLPDALALYGSVSSMLSIAMERRAASIHFATYERLGRSSGYRYALFHLLFVFVFGITMGSTFSYPTLTPLCAVVSPGGLFALNIVNTCLLVMEISTILIFASLLRRNKKTLKDTKFGMSLSEKYQLTENIRMLKLFLPVVCTHTSLTVAGLIAYFGFTLTGLGPDYYPMFEDSINFIYMQGIFMPTIFFFRYRDQRRQEQHLYSSNKPTDETFESRYTNAIQRGW